VLVKGTNFGASATAAAVTAISFDGVACGSITYVDSTTLTCSITFTTDGPKAASVTLKGGYVAQLAAATSAAFYVTPVTSSQSLLKGVAAEYIISDDIAPFTVNDVSAITLTDDTTNTDVACTVKVRIQNNTDVACTVMVRIQNNN
jgi:hypothetical protein